MNRTQSEPQQHPGHIAQYRSHRENNHLSIDLKKKQRWTGNGQKES